MNDGKFSNHFKKLFVTRDAALLYNVYEKDIVTYNPAANGKDEQPGILNFTLRDTDKSNESLTNSGIYFRSSPPILFTNSTSTSAFNFIRDAQLRDMPIHTFT